MVSVNSSPPLLRRSKGLMPLIMAAWHCGCWVAPGADRGHLWRRLRFRQTRRSMFQKHPRSSWLMESCQAAQNNVSRAGSRTQETARRIQSDFKIKHLCTPERSLHNIIISIGYSTAKWEIMSKNTIKWTKKESVYLWSISSLAQKFASSTKSGTSETVCLKTCGGQNNTALTKDSASLLNFTLDVLTFRYMFYVLAVLYLNCLQKKCASWVV